MSEGLLQNVWYMAAWADEITTGLLGRRIADQPVVLFRDDDGALVALEDRCPHRFAPLSLGSAAARPSPAAITASPSTALERASTTRFPIVSQAAHPSGPFR